VNDEDVPVGFFVLFDDVPLAGVIAVPTRVDGQHVDTGLAFDDPLRELPTGTARCGDTEAVSLVEPHVGQVPGGADERAAVRGIRNWSVDNVLDAAVLE